MLRAALATGLANNDPEALEIDVSIYQLTSHRKDLSKTQYFISHTLDMGPHRTMGVFAFLPVEPYLERPYDPLSVSTWLTSSPFYFLTLSSYAVTYAHGRLSHRVTARSGDTRAGVQEASAHAGTHWDTQSLRGKKPICTQLKTGRRPVNLSPSFHMYIWISSSNDDASCLCVVYTGQCARLRLDPLLQPQGHQALLPGTFTSA
jgi:hypothetical protein